MNDAGQKNLAMKLARLRIWRGTSADNGHYEEFDVAFEEGDSVLDGLVRLRYGPAPDLAFQFSCFNANVCKECVIMIDGVIDYACIAKLRSGLTQLDPVPEQRLLRDLLIDVRECDQKGATLRHQMQSLSERRRVLNVRS
jgi:succinate dehydrogenase / fumarate reductase iron-sulfur subunit